MSKWHNAFFCVDCKGVLSLSEKRHNYGVCPLCGYKHPNACTFVKTYQKSWRTTIVEHRRAPWWMFWKDTFKVYGIEWRDNEKEKDK